MIFEIPEVWIAIFIGVLFAIIIREMIK